MEKKRLTSLALAISMFFALSSTALAAETERTQREAMITAEIEAMEAEVYAEVYRQLEAQDGLHMLETYMAIFEPKIQAAVETKYGYSTASARATAQYDAPNGGRVTYTMVGLTEVEEYYMDKESTANVLELAGKKVSFWEFCRVAFGEASANVWQKAASYSFTSLMIAMNTLPTEKINAYVGYAYTINTYEPTTPATYSITMAWTTYPTIKIDNSSIVKGPTFSAAS